MPTMPTPTFVPMPMPMPSAPAAEMPTMPMPMPPGFDDTDGALNAQYRQIVELYEKGTYDAAIPLANELRNSIEGRFGKDTPPYAAAIGVLARLYQAKGDFAQAESYVNEAIAIDERELPPDHPNLASDLGALAQLYQVQGRFDEAEPRCKRALAISERTGDPASIGRDLNNLAWLYQGQGRYAEAEPLVMRSLDLIEKSLGTKADYGRALDTLAKIHEGQGRVSEAETSYRRALEILEASLGDAHESVAATRENLGGLLKSLGRLDEAELLLKQALDTQERVYGRANTKLASVLTQLGDLYRTQGKSDAAEAYFLRALAIHKENTREIDVYFATNRAPVEGAKTVAFGSLPAPSLTFGLAKVIVTNPNSAAGRTLSSEPFVEGAQVAQAPRVEVTEVARLAIHTITTGVDWTSPQSRKAFEKQVFVFVPGFNVSFENALRRAAQIAYDVDFDGAAVLFSWPSGRGLMSYLYSSERTREAGNQLMAFLETIVAQTGATKIHLIAHSMGSVVLLDTLEKLKIKREARHDSGAEFAEIILHSPDVAKDRFSQVMAEVSDLGSGATLYTASNDRAIALSRWIWGDRVDPTVFSGVETIDTTDAGSSFLGLNHDLYVTNPVIFNDMRYMLKQGKHPPDQRSGAFQSTVTPAGTLWRYHRNDVAPSVAAAPPVSAVSKASIDGAHPIPIAVPAVVERRDNALDLKRARDASDALQRSADELRAALSQAQEAKSAAEAAARSAVYTAQQSAIAAREELERERRARAQAESDAATARTELARERALAAQLAEEKKTATAPIVVPAAAPLTTGTTPAPPAEKAEAEAKRARDANARAARKRRAAKEAAQNWPFSGW
ncbi:MAG: tetratricopeptide repeat protein [Hyphomicrobium sp.]